MRNQGYKLFEDLTGQMGEGGHITEANEVPYIKIGSRGLEPYNQ
jgi:hypothetical protein